jgi:hypothetical protein
MGAKLSMDPRLGHAGIGGIGELPLVRCGLPEALAELQAHRLHGRPHRRAELVTGAEVLGFDAVSSHAGVPRPATSDTAKGGQAQRPTA